MSQYRALTEAFLAIELASLATSKDEPSEHSQIQEQRTEPSVSPLKELIRVEPQAVSKPHGKESIVDDRSTIKADVVKTIEKENITGTSIRSTSTLQVSTAVQRPTSTPISRSLLQLKTSTPLPEKIRSSIRINWMLADFTRNFISSSTDKTVLESKPFEISVGRIKTKWILKLNPNRNGYISLYFSKKEESSQNYELSAKLSLNYLEHEFHALRISQMKAAVLPVGSSWGYVQFISHKAFLSRFSESERGSTLNVRIDFEISACGSEGEVFMHQSCKA